jgi:hypothetical protein
MVARGELRNDAAVVGMHLDLAVQGLREKSGVASPSAGHEGDAGFVAGGLDAEDAASREFRRRLRALRAQWIRPRRRP